MSHSNLKLDQDQERVGREFAEEASANMPRMAQALLKQFNSVLSTRLACHFCTVYNQSDHTKGYYRPAIIETTQAIINHAWKTILDSSNGRAVVIIAGGGPGSGKLTAIQNPPLALKKEISAIYEAGEETIFTLRNLIEQAHAKRVPTTLVYIQRPLAQAAAATIIRATNEGLIPSPKEFASKHANALNNFLALVARYKKKQELFSPVIITNEPKAKTAYTTSHRFLKQNRFTENHAQEIFRQVWNELQNSEGLALANKSQHLFSLNRPRKSKNRFTTRNLLIAHLISQTLRKNLIEKEMQAERSVSLREVSSQSASIQAPPIAQLTHERCVEDRAILESTAHWRDRTLEGQLETLEREHPARTVVQEKKTHEHEMETILVR